jgi:hypothetical protein
MDLESGGVYDPVRLLCCGFCSVAAVLIGSFGYTAAVFIVFILLLLY